MDMVHSQMVYDGAQPDFEFLSNFFLLFLNV